MSQPSPTKKVRRPEVVRGDHRMLSVKVKMIGNSLRPLLEAYLVTGAGSWSLPGPLIHVASVHYSVSWPPYAPITVSALP